MQYITLSEAKAKFSEIVEKAMAGEDIMVTKMGKPAVKVIAAVEKPKKRLLGCLQGKGVIYDDKTFNEWPEEEARALGIID